MEKVKKHAFFPEEFWSSREKMAVKPEKESLKSPEKRNIQRPEKESLRKIQRNSDKKQSERKSLQTLQKDHNSRTEDIV